MAKIRVYELAKKLNLTNRALLTKLKSLEIEVKSHMSSLEDEDVSKVKASMFGQKKKEAETRVKTSVIRRRKPVKKKTPAESSPAEQETESVPTMKTSSRKKDEKTSDAAGNEASSGDKDLNKGVGDSGADVVARDAAHQETGSSVDGKGVVEKNILSHEPTVEKASDTSSTESVEQSETETLSKKAAPSPSKPVKSKKKTSVAKIISAPLKSEPEPEPEPEPVVPEKEITPEPPVSEKIVIEEPLVSETVVETAVKEDETGQQNPEDSALNQEAKPSGEAEPPAEKSMSAQDEKTMIDTKEEGGALDKVDADNDSESEVRGDDSSDAVDKKRPRKKKAKKSEPAKIIKLAIAPVIPPPRKKVGTQGGADVPRHRKKVNRPSDPRPSVPPRKVKVEAPPVSPADLPGGDSSGKTRPKKDKRKKWEAPVGAAGAPAKALARKKRSVVEGKDLYDGKRGGKKGRRKDNRNKQRGKVQKTQITTPKAIKRRVKVDDTIELAELAKRMGIKANEMIVKLMGMGVMATVNQTIDYDTAALVAVEFDYEVERASFEEDLLMDLHVEENPDDLIGRSPVVTIMGHVDHGKTSLLDVIRKSKITTGEAGGITQHIGAYSVETPKGLITFLDTPGHAAFTAMRSRGAQVTDLVVLVVAADDGVMPQTIEAINHSKSAKVPVIVAVNKMDKPDADPDRVMRELSEHGMVSEDWGGDVIFAKVSAKAGTGIDELLEMILLQAEVLELKANPTRPAMGHVVEARLDAGRGPVATVLVEQGTLKVGAPLVCGLHSGKIRIMIGDSGQTVTEAGPSTPVEIVGLSGVPEAGDEFMALSSGKDAKQISEHRMQKERAKELAKKSRANLEKLFANMGSDDIKELKLIIKADVHGSLEALNDSVMKLAQEEVDIKIVHSGTGAINESDISLAAVSDAIIIGFNVRPTPKVRGLAKEENIDMRFYDIIYNVINDIKAALTGLMPSTFHESILGRAEVRDVFVIPNRGTVAGSFVLDGKVTRGDKIRLLRDGVVKCKSTVASLRRFKDDMKEVAQGYECGIGIEKYNDIKMGDIFECYEIEERKATLEQIKE